VFWFWFRRFSVENKRRHPLGMHKETGKMQGIFKPTISFVALFLGWYHTKDKRLTIGIDADSKALL
jgi:hypothetical protein